MSALVNYGSSDDGDEEEPVERPSKIARLEQTDQHKDSDKDVYSPIQPATQAEVNGSTPTVPQVAALPAPEGPQLGPAAPSVSGDVSENPDESPQLSPYSLERHRVRELTMPTVPNFSIPDAPSPPPMNSERAASLSVTTRKFERFLELKNQGVHFNERLQNSASLRNPSLLPKLMEFAGITLDDSYALTIPEDGGGMPTKWPKELYVENLMKANDRKLAEEKKRTKAEGKVDFVSAASNQPQVATTSTSAQRDVSKRPKSRFDQH